MTGETREPDAGAVATHAGGIEVELTYAVRDPASAEAFLQVAEIGGLGAGDVRSIVVEDVYVDTAGRAIEAAGYAARLRHTPEGTIVGLKALAPEALAAEAPAAEPLASDGAGSRADGARPGDAALHRRREIEGAATDSLDAADWPEGEARALLREIAGDAPLRERFRVRQERRERALEGPPGAATLTLDDVEVLRDGDTLGRFTMLEVELARGDERLLGAVARTVEESGLAIAEPLSKFELAARLVAVHDAAVANEPLETPATELRAEADDMAVTPNGRDAGAPGQAAGTAPGAGAGQEGAPPSRDRHEERGRRELKAGRSPGVLADDTLAEAGRKVLRFHLAKMLAAEDGTRSGKDLEELHKMRVATRRMRAAWRVFGDAYRPRRVKRYVRELRALATALGAVRDLDVLIEALDAHRRSLPADEGAALEPLLDSWQRNRERAREVLLDQLDSDGYRRFVDDYIAFVDDGGATVDWQAAEPHRVRDTAGSRIWESYEHVRSYDAVLRWADIPTIHQLRIAGKRLRYTLEFFREPLGPDVGALIDRVTALQDHVGLLHDADVAASLARAFLVERSARLSPAQVAAVGRYLPSREAEVRRLQRSLGPVWRRIVAADFRRALGRSISAL